MAQSKKAAAPGVNVTETLSFTKETKRMVRYDNPDQDNGVVGNVYLPKAIFPGAFPATVNVTITAE